MSQNIYDNEKFFNGYKALRESKDNHNILLEQPAMAELVPNVKGKKVLDLGCGFGQNCEQFVKAGAAEVIGVDLSGKMLEVAKSNNKTGEIKYIQMDIAQIDKLEIKFDVIYSSLAFHYIQDFNSFVKKLSNILNIGGILLFSQEHPIATASIDGGKWVKCGLKRKIAYRMSDYNKSGERQCFWYVGGVIKYHRPFGEIINNLVENGFCIQKIVEPVPSIDALKIRPGLIKEYLKPCFLIVLSKFFSSFN